MFLDDDYLNYDIDTSVSCPYQFPLVFGGCPAECPCISDCPCYDGDDLQTSDNIE